MNSRTIPSLSSIAASKDSAEFVLAVLLNTHPCADDSRTLFVCLSSLINMYRSLDSFLTPFQQWYMPVKGTRFASTASPSFEELRTVFKQLRAIAPADASSEHCAALLQDLVSVVWQVVFAWLRENEQVIENQDIGKFMQDAYCTFCVDHVNGSQLQSKLFNASSVLVGVASVLKCLSGVSFELERKGEETACESTVSTQSGWGMQKQTQSERTTSTAPSWKLKAKWL
eukprot:ANDGO_01341.mRNA.1 hypothetical protein